MFCPWPRVVARLAAACLVLLFLASPASSSPVVDKTSTEAILSLSSDVLKQSASRKLLAAYKFKGPLQITEIPWAAEYTTANSTSWVSRPTNMYINYSKHKCGKMDFEKDYK